MEYGLREEHNRLPEVERTDAAAVARRRPTSLIPLESMLSIRTADAVARDGSAVVVLAEMDATAAAAAARAQRIERRRSRTRWSDEAAACVDDWIAMEYHTGQNGFVRCMSVSRH